jgi:hypothetical protein
MLWTIFVILLVLWLSGLVTSYTMGGFVHVLLVIAVVILVIQLVQGRRGLSPGPLRILLAQRSPTTPARWRLRPPSRRAPRRPR